MDTNEFLDSVKERHQLPSDYAVAKFFGWRISRIYDYRGSGRELDEEACIQVAAALELPPAYVMACIREARAKSADVKKYWREAAMLLKTGTAAVMAAVALTMGSPSTSAAQSAPRSLTEQSIHYAPKRRRDFCAA